MQPATVIFIGPQGSGKGTQIDKLRTALEEVDPTRKVVDIQTGRRFRAMAAKGEGYTEQHVQETLNSGVLQPLFLSTVLWGDAMIQHVDQECHLLIDGFPRIVREARILDTALTFYKRDPITVVNLETPESVVRERMQSRAREDDTDDSIEERLRWYREETMPVIEYYRTHPHANVCDIDGTQTIEEVQAAICATLGI